MNICPQCGSEEDHKRDACSECGASLDLHHKYRLVKLLNKGMAETFLAVADHDDPASLDDGKPTKARFVVKRIDVAGIDDWKHLELFKREAAVLSRLRHDSIPRYIDHFADEEGGSFFLVQAYVSAPSVETVAVREGFDEARIFDIGRQVLDILEYLHSLEPPVIHRDIKPDNLLINDDGHVWLVDFGTVRAAIQNSTVGGTTVVGTLGYMAPEQFYGQATPATDLFGLGATMLRLLTGKHPADFPHDGIEIDLTGQLEHLSPRARVTIATLMRPRPSERPQSVAEARRLFGSLGSGQGLEHVASDTPSLADAINRAADALNRSISGHRAASKKQPRRSGTERAASAIEGGVNVFGEIVEALAAGIDVATRPLTQSQKALPPPPKQKALPAETQERQGQHGHRARQGYHLAHRRGDQLPAKRKWTPVTVGAIVMGIILFFFLL